MLIKSAPCIVLEPVRLQAPLFGLSSQSGTSELVPSAPPRAFTPNMISLVLLQVLLWTTPWAAAHQILARGQGCSEIPTRTYTINNSTFTIICNTTWDGSLYLNVMYTPNFTSCLEACVDWADETPCVGAQWDYSSPGYDGGYLCHLLWSMPPNNSTAATFKSEVDSAQLNPGPPPVHQLCFRD